MDKGIYTVTLGEQRPDGSTPTGVVSAVDSFNNVEATTDIPGRLGLEFGFQYVIVGEPAGAEVPVDITYGFPPPGLVDPADPKPMLESRITRQKMIGETIYLGYGFENDWEIVPGEWTITISFEGRELVRQSFAVLEAKVEPQVSPPATASPGPSVVAGKGVSIRLDTLTTGGQSLTTISVGGEFKFGDEERFVDAALSVTGPVVVVLNSPGGNLMAGIKIGEAIRLKGFRTLVMDGSMCASACALAWLGGRPRLLGPDAYVGFHAAFNEDPAQSVTAPGNAFVGSYLNRLGLSDDAIAYMTTALPTEMQWLTFDDADLIGLEVKEFTCADCALTPLSR